MREAGSLVAKRILITGASGGVGHYVSELAIAAGASVTALVRTPERGEVLARLGVTVVTDLDSAVGPFDVVMESLGGSLFSDSLLRLRPGGLMLWFGQAIKSAGAMPFFDVLSGPSGLTIKHFSYVDGSELGEDLRILVDSPAAGSKRRLRPTRLTRDASPVSPAPLASAAPYCASETGDRQALGGPSPPM